MRNYSKKTIIHIGDFQKFWPNLPSDAQMIECHEGICKLPSGGEVSLDTKFMFNFEGESYLIHSASFMGMVAYFVEKT